MIRTSSFKVSGKEQNAVSIAVSAPRGWKGEKYPDLAPPRRIIRMVNSVEYTKIYTAEVLEHLDPQSVGDDLDGRILLCWEPAGEFCHRQLVARWLMKNHISCAEVGAKIGVQQTLGGVCSLDR
jgi:hypothetical protein